MTLYLPKGLPCLQTLAGEGLQISHEAPRDALKIGLVNLMPNKRSTERQIARVLGTSQRDISLHLIRLITRPPRPSYVSHLARFYSPADPIVLNAMDGLIVTGAPVERMPFEEVDYWEELATLLDLARARAVPCLFICWAAQAALYRHHGVPKQMCSGKISGVYTQSIADPNLWITKGMTPRFEMPVSRHTTVTQEAIADCPELRIAAGGGPTGPAIVEEPATHAVYVFNHLEYEGDTLACEYRRDCATDPTTPPPKGAQLTPLPKRTDRPWAHAAGRLFGNWVDLVAEHAHCTPCRRAA